MDWKDDERLYQPRVHSRHIRRLHQLSELTGQPMTIIVDQALTEYIERLDTKSQPHPPTSSQSGR
jgi:predicted DNA-binding protein